MDSLPSQTSSLNLAPGVQRYSLGNWKLQSGQEIPDAHIAYKTFGDPGSPAIIYPSWFSGAIADNEWLIGETQALNPRKYFIIITALFGNGESSSPSNTPLSLSPFPKVTFYDNVRAQHKLLTIHLQITHARAVIGWSMGAAQTYQWATMYPSFMDICIPFCGSAKTALHNQVFLEGVKSALLAGKGMMSAGSSEGVVVKGRKEKVRVWSEEEREVGLKAFGRGYAGWGFSQTPKTSLTMLHTWSLPATSPTKPPYNGDFSAAMNTIEAKMLVLPCKTDLYFPPEDSQIEVSLMRPGIGTLEIIPSIWGHWAGGPGDSKEDVKWLNERLVAVGL
ncbi:hypothetical protein SS1G_07410 [Sclerotinia sclerotiorum 1980 UF-70]|uniref:Uncharacterized protein n=1 Tax=Sclerotinia sclerotiorum (strain ATCC 18683 / 1980 / Ss-1) TaxID=665079 RepID=A7EQ10_SCLS1|nr:hypothetical protein SS1G_07410 [Sclerotinia sclerotiorum 1980 UF-70]EDO04926.1 hypothetical protein SS1G_07410 [Sclerotinia sclerotiorum 1980 UF-70]